MFIDEWKEQCREEFGLALLYYVLTTLCSMVGGIVGVLILNGEDDTTKQMLTSSMASSFYFATGMFICVILLASYDKFLEEYEQSFTKLKE
jgi:tetrahydromethanopterin S-methyltransferase subunit D